MHMMGRWHLAQMNRMLARILVQLTCVLVLIGLGAPQFVSAEAVIQFSNPSFLGINDAFKANPYPSTITVSGVRGNITNIALTLHDITHPKPSDIDIMLEGPRSRLCSIIMSDAGGAAPLSNVTIALDDNAGQELPVAGPLISGTSYRPQNYGGVDTDNFEVGPLPSGAPNPNTCVSPSALSTFNGIDPNGTWNLWIVDSVSEVPPGNGSIAGGWTLTITTDAAESTEVGITLNQRIFGIGDILRVGLHAQNPVATTVSADFYFAVLLPNGVTLVFVDFDGNVVTGRLDADPSTFVPAVANATLPTGLDVTINNFLLHVFDGTEAPGVYICFALLTTPGASADGVLDGSEIIHLSLAPFSFIPGTIR
jgi:subtilisin-like proprotein convertase family protein